MELDINKDCGIALIWLTQEESADPAVGEHPACLREVPRAGACGRSHAFPQGGLLRQHPPSAGRCTMAAGRKRCAQNGNPRFERHEAASASHI